MPGDGTRDSNDAHIPANKPVAAPEVVDLETNAIAYTWKQVIAHASKLYDSLDTYWSPAGNTTLNANPLQIKVA